ncbi:hypothetical protein ABBQ32_010458 [Trebouxia sp. C0010 RCD-2024]
MAAGDEEQQALLAAEDALPNGTRASTDCEVTSQKVSPPQVPDGEIPILAQSSLYATHWLSTWGQRVWEFAIGLIMLEVYPSSLALVSAFGLVDSLAKVFCGSSVGSYIDRTTRLKAACSMYVMQHTALVLSALSALVSLQSHQGSAVFWTGVACTIGFGSVSSIGAQGSTLSVEKEWTVVLCNGNSAALAKVNSGMRAIDLSCLLLAPIAAGFLMTYTSISTAIVAIAAWNLAACVPECYLLVCAQRASAVLRAAKQLTAKAEFACPRTDGGWGTYFKQTLWPAALALALLYLTVLSLGMLMTAYLKWQGITEAKLSLYRGAGAVSGLAATVIFPRLLNRSGLKTTGVMGIWWQAVSLVLAVAPVWLAQLGVHMPASAASHILLGGLVASRFGLWLFDLAVSQMLQEWVPAKNIGMVPAKAVKALALPCNLWHKKLLASVNEHAMCTAWH